MLLKKGVSIAGCRAEILIAAITIIAPLYKRYGHQLVITSGTEDVKHSVKRSKHYCGDALDLRHYYFSDKAKHQVVEELKLLLGDNFVILLERHHIHVHYAPVYEA